MVEHTPEHNLGVQVNPTSPELGEEKVSIKQILEYVSSLEKKLCDLGDRYEKWLAEKYGLKDIPRDVERFEFEVSELGATVDEITLYDLLVEVCGDAFNLKASLEELVRFLGE